MRTTLLLLLAGLLISISVSAQTTLTIKAQNGKSWQNYGDDFPINGYDQNILHYGISTELFRAVTPYFSIGIAPGYMRRGAACEPGFITGDFAGPIPFIDATIFLDYFQLPFLARVEFPIAGKFEAFAQGGAGFSYLVGGYREIITIFNLNTTIEERQLDFSGADQNLNRFDFGWSSTLGFAYRIGTGKLRVSGEHYYSFLDMNQNNTSLNRNWGVALGYQIALSKVD